MERNKNGRKGGGKLANVINTGSQKLKIKNSWRSWTFYYNHLVDINLSDSNGRSRGFLCDSDMILAQLCQQVPVYFVGRCIFISAAFYAVCGAAADPITSHNIFYSLR